LFIEVYNLLEDRKFLTQILEAEKEDDILKFFQPKRVIITREQIESFKKFLAGVKFMPENRQVFELKTISKNKQISDKELEGVVAGYVTNLTKRDEILGAVGAVVFIAAGVLGGYTYHKDIKDREDIGKLGRVLRILSGFFGGVVIGAFLTTLIATPVVGGAALIGGFWISRRPS
jgi:ribosomal protein S17E